MSYAKLLKQWEREYKKKQKQEREERKRQREKQEYFRNEIYIAKGIQEKQEQKEREEKQERIINIKGNILESLQKNNPFTYQQFLIIYDILSYNFNQILSDIQRGKITITDIKITIEYIENFSNELICDFWKDRLLQEI